MRIMGVRPFARVLVGLGVTKPAGGLFTRSLSGCSYVAMFRPALPFRRAMVDVQGTGHPAGSALCSA